MGLDMYLKARQYVGGWDHSAPDEKAAYSAITKALKVPELRAEGSPSLEVELTVLYWRKANQIHKWFVEQVQGGEDDCEDYDVSREKLVELAELCERVLADSKLVDGEVHNGTYFTGGVETQIIEEGKVIADPAIAKKLLPAASGFFFGSTDYDEWYLRDLEHTAKGLREILANPAFEGCSFSYRSSW